jgi:hypothetical protein
MLACFFLVFSLFSVPHPNFFHIMTNDSTFIYKMHSRCFGIMRDHGNFAFNLVVKLSVELG